MDGPAQYHFVFSDGSQIAPQSIDLKKGQNFELSTTWTLSANMKGAWAGVQFGDGGPMHMSTFSMTCSGAAPGGTKTPGPVMTPIPGPVMTPGPIKTPVAVNQQKCPAGTRPATVVFNSNKKMEGCMKPESFLCGNGYREMTSVTGFSFCGSREALNPKSQKCPNEIFLDPSDKQQHCREADSDKCPAGFRMEKPVGENQFHCVTSGAAH